VGERFKDGAGCFGYMKGSLANFQPLKRMVLLSRMQEVMFCISAYEVHAVGLVNLHGGLFL